LRSLAQLPYVVGADWFQYYDEPPHGRSLDGEDYNFGLVDIHDRPYSAVTAAFAALDLVSIKRAAANRGLDTTAVVLPAPADPFADFRASHALKHWDRHRGFVAPDSAHPRGDLYACWSPSALYLAAYILDIVEPDYYRAREMPDEDRAAWTIRVSDGEPITVRVGSGKPAASSESSLRLESLGGTYHDVRTITAIALPAKQLGKSKLAPGDKIKLDSSYTTHGQAYRMNWSAELVLAE
jgi:hypothetical protein